MRRRKLVHVVLALGVLLPAASAYAQTADPSPEAKIFGAWMESGLTLDALLEKAEKEFVEAGTGPGALSAADIELHQAFLAARAAPEEAKRVMVMDTDGDGLVSAAEIESDLIYRSRERVTDPTFDLSAYRQRRMEDILRLDTNGDGFIAWTEAANRSIPGAMRQLEELHYSEKVRQALTLDAASDGEVTRAEYTDAAEAVFRRADSDGDGVISDAEADAYRRRLEATAETEMRRAAQEAARRTAEARQGGGAAEVDAALAEAVETVARAGEVAGCAMPAPSADAEMIAVGVNVLQVLSSVAIGTENVPVHFGRVVIEPGEAPLYLIITSRVAAIWQFAGALERVEQVVLRSSTAWPGDDRLRIPLVGEIGLPLDRVTFFGPQRCMLNFTKVPGSWADEAADFVREQAGRAPDAMFAQIAVSEASLPSGRLRKFDEVNPNDWPPITGNPRYRAAAMAEIDAAAVFASLPALPYAIPPGWVGMRQLERDGALTLNDDGYYVIRQEMRFPAGVGGIGVEARFLLPRGVPMPDGDPGHAKVFDEETGLEIEFDGP